MGIGVSIFQNRGSRSSHLDSCICYDMTSISVNRSKHHHIKEAYKRTIAAFSTMSTNTADGDDGDINLGAALTTLTLVLLLAVAVILCKYTAACNTLWYVLGVGRLCDVCICIGLCDAVLTVPWANFYVI